MNQHFFIIGAQRCGTTYVADYLSRYDEINFIKPLKPEPKYFSVNSKKKINLKEYMGLYQNYGTNKFYGEKSTDYIENIDSLKLIHNFIPEAKILIILRNPIYRCISNYKLSKESGFEKLPFEEAIRTNPIGRAYTGVSSNPFNYLARGLYINYLKKVYKIFNKKNINIFILEELLDSEMSNLLNIFDLRPIEKELDLNLEFNRSNTKFSLNSEQKSFLIKFFYKSVCELEKFIGRKIVKWNEFQ